MGLVFRGARRPRRRGAGFVIYLASSSPRRRAILKDLGIPFRRVLPAYEETPLPGRRPSRVVRTHALEKARSAARRFLSGVVLGADTVVYCGGQIIGKPADRKAALRTLLRLQGRWHTVYTGVALLWLERGRVVKKRLHVETTRVRLRKMNRAAALAYFRRVHPLDKAGAYAIQSRRAGVVEEIRGSFSNAMGLPVESLREFL